MEGTAPHRGLMRVLPSLCALFLAAALRAAAAEPPADHFRLTTDGGRSPSVAVDSNGCSHITWSSGGVIMYLRVTGRLGYDATGQLVDLGSDPANPVPLQPIVVSEALLTDSTPKIAVDRQGNAHIVFGLNSRIGLKYFKISQAVVTEQGLLQILPRPVSITYLYSSPSIAIDSSTDADLPVVTAIVEGTQRVTTGGHYDYLYLPFIGLWPLFVYPFETTYGSEQVVVFRLDSTGNVSSLLKLFSDSRVGFPAYRAEHPAVAVDSTGQVHAVWKYRATDPQNSNETHEYVAYQNEAGAMQSPIPAPTWISLPDTVGGDGGPVLARDAGDKLHVAWYDPQGKGRIWYSRRSATAGQEVAATVVTSDDAVVTGAPALAVDTELVRIVWPDSRPSKPELDDSHSGVFLTALLNNEAGAVERPPRDGDSETDFRLRDGLDAVFCPGIGVSPFGVPTIVWEDQRYDGRNEVLVFRPPWTFLVYVSADNDLYEDYLTTVLDGMERGAYNPCVTTVVQFDGAADKDSRRFLMRFDTSPDTTFSEYDYRYAIRGKDYWYIGPSGVRDDPGEVNMGSPATLTDFVKWGTVNFPAARTMLAIDDHGSGWLPRFPQEGSAGTKAIALDENGTHGDTDYADDTSLSLKELRSALESSGQKPDVLFLDACLMGMLEVAYELRERADYLLFSQAAIAMNPLYRDYLPGLKVDADALAVAKQMASCFQTYFVPTNDAYTIAAIDCTKVEALADQVLALTQAIVPPPDQPPDPNRPNLKAKCFEACGKAQKVDDDGRFTDLYDWCAKLKAALTDVPEASAISTAAQTVMSLISPVGDDELVVAEGHDTRRNLDCHGLSIYFPFTRPNLGIEGVPEDGEEDAGAFIAVFGDPSNPKTTRAYIRFTSGQQQGTVTLSRSNAKVRVWAVNDDGSKTPLLVDKDKVSWDLANPSERDAFTDIRTRLAIDGTTLGVSWLSLLLVDGTRDGTWSEDRVKVTLVKVDLYVNDTMDEEDDIVCRYSTTPAGRPTVPCRARVQGLDSGRLTVALRSRDGGGGEVRFPDAADSVRTITLPASGAWEPFSISGQVRSMAMNDAVIEAHLDAADGPICAEEDVTVLWVDIEGCSSGSALEAPLYEDNASLAGDDELGVHIRTVWGIPEQGLIKVGVGAIEIRGSISPPDLDVGAIPTPPLTDGTTDFHRGIGKGFIMVRKVLTRRIYQDGVELVDYRSDNEEDDSPFLFQDISPDTDSAGKLLIVDNDAPSTSNLRESRDVRLRASFNEWVTFTYRPTGINKKQVVRCSDDFEWATRVRIERDGTGGTCLWRNDANGNGISDPGDDLPSDGKGENEVIIGGHTAPGP